MSGALMRPNARYEAERRRREEEEQEELPDTEKETDKITADKLLTRPSEAFNLSSAAFKSCKKVNKRKLKIPKQF